MIVKTTADFSAFHVNGTVFPFSVIVAGRAEAHEKNRTLSDRLEGLSQRLKLRNILTFQFRPNLFKPFDIRPRVHPFPTMKTHFHAHSECGSMIPTPKQFFHILFGNFAATYGTFVKGDHFSLLMRHSIHRSGAGRYVVTRTAHLLFSLYAHTL